MLAHRIASSLLLLVALGGGSGGCINYAAAKGTFTGRVSLVQVQTADRRWHTVYVMAVDEGPPFRDNKGEREVFASSGRKAVLVRNRRGDIYTRGHYEEGQMLEVDGVMFPCVADAPGGAMVASGGGVTLPDYGLDVSRIRSRYVARGKERASLLNESKVSGTRPEEGSPLAAGVPAAP